MDRVFQLFKRIATFEELVKHHAFDHGEGTQLYHNFTFGTIDAQKLWQIIKAEIYEDPELGKHMQAASMAMCSMEDGWYDYLILYHYDPQVSPDKLDNLVE
ncbi:MAG: hypothetical protein IT327_26750 [Anaerolineae bacterium]|nr:hypothetical protein [Anaerolineae bacterium]